jgi:tetratricopeptide (TPR) repeat protein
MHLFIYKLIPSGAHLFLFINLHAKCGSMMLRFIVCCILLSGFLTSNVLLSQQGTSDSTMLNIDKFVATGHTDKALLLIEDILFRDPSNLDIQEKKLNILIQADRTKDAYDDVEKLIIMYPSHPEYLYLKAVLNLQKQKFSKAIDDFDKAITLKMPPKSLYKVYLNRGMAHFYMQDYDLADYDFSKVLELEPKNAAAYHGKGMVKYELHEYEDAVTAFQKSLNFDENNAITHFNMGMSYFRLEDKENSCYHFNRACALGNRNACRLLLLECTQELKNAK